MQLPRRAARIAAHLIILLLAAAWITGAQVSLALPMFDLDRPGVGDAIVSVAAALELSYHATLILAHALPGFRLALGLYLVATVLIAAYDRVRWGETDDAMLDVGLFLSAFSSGVAALLLVPQGGPFLIGALGEIMLAAMSGALAAYGHGAQWRLADVRWPRGSAIQQPV